MGNTFFFQWEVDLIVRLQMHLGSIGKALSVFFTYFGDYVLMVSILALVYLCINKKAGKLLFTNIFFVILLCPMIKNIALRRRPYFDHEQIECLKIVDSSKPVSDILAQGYSFPSMHSANAMGLFGSIAMLAKKKSLFIIACILAFLVGISRVALGVHYPTDVITGWLVGLFAAIVLTTIQQKIKNPHILYLILTLIGCVGWFYCTSDDFFTCFGLMIGGFGGFLFEEKFVNFEDTRSLIQIILRLVGSIAVFLIIVEGSKMLLPTSLSEGTDLPAHIIRTLRYVLGTFATIGLFPMCFKHIAKVGKK